MGLIVARNFLVAAAIQVVLGTDAIGCDGQGGAVIFEDNFSDDSGGWDLSKEGVSITPPVMKLEIGKSRDIVSTLNLTFNAGDGEYCRHVVFPAQIAGNPLSAGIQFWSTDADNLF